MMRQGPVESRGEGRQRRDIVEMIDHQHEIGPTLEQAPDPIQHVGRDHGRGYEDTGEAALGHRLGLGDGGAGWAERPRRLQPAGDLDAFVRLRMRPERHAGCGRVRHHGRDVALQRIEIEHQGRRRQQVALHLSCSRPRRHPGKACLARGWGRVVPQRGLEPRTC